MLDDVLPVGGPYARVLFHFGINAVGTVYAVAATHAAGWQRWASAIGLPARRTANKPERPASSRTT
jgi:hypothetical protein